MNDSQIDQSFRLQKLSEKGMGVLLLGSFLIHRPIMNLFHDKWDRQVPLVLVIVWLVSVSTPGVFYIRKAMINGKIVSVFLLSFFLLILFFITVHYLFG